MNLLRTHRSAGTSAPLTPRVATMDVDRLRSVPLHVQVEEQLAQQIESGIWEAGCRLPTETDLATMFSVNRLTIRQAIASLSRMGMVTVRQGAGTFVAEPAVRIDMESFPERLDDAYGFTQDDRLSGVTVEETLLDLNRVTVRGEALAELGSDSALEIETSTAFDGTPSIHSVYTVPCPLSVDEARERINDNFTSLTLQDLLDTELWYGWRAFDAVGASRRSAALLEVAAGTPVLRRSGVNVDTDGVARTYQVRHYRSDRLRIVMRSSPTATRLSLGR